MLGFTLEVLRVEGRDPQKLHGFCFAGMQMKRPGIQDLFSFRVLGIRSLALSVVCAGRRLWFRIWKQAVAASRSRIRSGIRIQGSGAWGVRLRMCMALRGFPNNKEPPQI